MTTLDDEGEERLVFHAKGAPLELLERCTHVLRDGGDAVLDEAGRRRIHAAFDDLAGRGMRVLGFADRAAEPGAEIADRGWAESRLTFLGLVAMEDPLRPEVPAAVARCHGAGIRIIVVTGDHGLTAAAIARQAGIVRNAPTILTEAEIEALPQAELDRVLHETGELIVARSTPETKLHLPGAPGTA